MSGLVALSAKQIAVLNDVHHGDLLYGSTGYCWTPHSDIAARLGQNYQAISNTTASLVHRGLLVRRKSNRKTQYRITEQGAALLAKSRSTHGKETP